MGHRKSAIESRQFSCCRFIVLGVLSTLALAGCVSLPLTAPLPKQSVARRDEQRISAPIEGKRVQPGGACLELGEAEKAAVSPEEFLLKVNELLTEQRHESARRFIHSYPDVAQETLRHVTNEQCANVGIQFIAEVHDQQCGIRDSADGWQVLVRDRTANPARFTAYEVTRQQFVELLHSGKAGEAIALRLSRDTPAPLLEVDAHQLMGEAYLLDNKPGDAAASFTAAIKRTSSGHPYRTVQLMLLLGEAQRRAGKKAEGTGTWQQAVLQAAQLLDRPIPVIDPLLWERAAYLRPVQCAWAAPVIKQLQFGLPTAKVGADEAWLWARIGQWRLDRNEPRAALVACKRAESFSVEQRFQERVQLMQAQALAQLQQPAAATAILVHLAKKSDSPEAAPALAMLGALKLNNGSTRQALALLKKAVEQGPEANWPGRGEAEANLGLAYLMVGNEEQGFRWLHAGQRRFAAAREHGLLVQSLENEARYLSKVAKASEAEQLTRRIQALESGRSVQ